MLVSFRYCRRKLFRLLALAHRRAQDIIKWVLQPQALKTTHAKRE